MALLFITAFVLSFLLIAGLVKKAPRFGLVDIPNKRSVHSEAVPRGAGIGIIVSFFVSVALFDTGDVAEFPLTFLSFLLVFIIGILDDLRDASPHTKFLVIFIATTMAWFEGIGIFSGGSFFGHEVALGWFALPFTLFAVSGFTNALNLVDGLDGLSGSISIVILAVLFSLGYRNGDSFIMYLSLTMIAAITAFLYFNWNPAKIFLGDSGSLTIGYIISILSIKALAYIHPTIILFLAAVPILDTLVVMVRRKRQGLSAFTPDKTHLHHILLRFFNGNVKRAVVALVMMQIAYSMTGMFIMEEIDQTFVLLLFGINFILIYLISSAMLANQKHIESLEKEVETLRHDG